MPLDAADERWIKERLDRQDRDLAHLFVATQKGSLKMERLDGQLRAVDSRNKVLWALVTTLGLSLGAGVVFHMQRLGGIEAKLDNAVDEAKTLRADLKALTNELHDHERRASVPRSEPTK